MGAWPSTSTPYAVKFRQRVEYWYEFDNDQPVVGARFDGIYI
jgi:hypothetical protein